MPTIGLIVEGEYDQAAIPVLLKRCRNGLTVIARKCRGPVAAKAPGILGELDRSYRADKVLIVSDADGQQPTRIVRSIKSRIVKTYRFAVCPIIIVEKLEAWLIADPAALESAAGITRSFANPERIRDPKAELRRLLRPRTPYTPAIAQRIAEETDLNLLGQRCPRFLTFREAVLDP